MISTYFSRHAQVLIGSLGRLAEQPIAALMTVSVIAIALALPLCLHLLIDNARNLSGNWSNAVDLSVYLTPQAPLARAQSIAATLRARPDVAAVHVITAAQGLAEFRSHSGFGSALDALTENPLPNALNVTPTLIASTPGGTELLKREIAAQADVAAVQLDTEWVTRFHAILEALRRVVWICGAMLLLGVVLVIGNTIRLDILNRRAEIEVMKLVGGTDGFARRPFLYSGVWYGLGGGALALILVSVARALLAQPVEHLAAAYGSAFQLRPLGLYISLLVVGGAAGLGLIGSWLAATRHIRSIEPT